MARGRSAVRCEKIIVKCNPQSRAAAIWGQRMDGHPTIMLVGGFAFLESNALEWLSFMNRYCSTCAEINPESPVMM